MSISPPLSGCWNLVEKVQPSLNTCVCHVGIIREKCQCLLSCPELDHGLVPTLIHARHTHVWVCFPRHGRVTVEEVPVVLL